MIYRRDLEFLQEAKRAFENNPRWETYRNDEETYIALRWGLLRDGIVIYRLGDEVGHFAEIMNRAPELVLKEERKDD